MIDILYFASVKEKMGRGAESITVEDGITGARLVEFLANKGEPWQSVLTDSKLLIAVNQEMVGWDDIVRDGDEVAFFPPVTGG